MHFKNPNLLMLVFLIVFGIVWFVLEESKWLSKSAVSSTAKSDSNINSDSNWNARSSSSEAFLSPAQQKWSDFEQNISRKAVYVTGRFSRKVGTYKEAVQAFKKRIVESGLPESRVFAYADTFPDFIVQDIGDIWKRHTEFLTINGYWPWSKSPTERGAGYWFWKAPLILHHLQAIDMGDFLFYADADSGANGDLEYMDDLIRTMMERGHNFAAWRYADNSKPKLTERSMNKRDLYDYYCPDRNQNMDYSGQYNGGWMLMEKTPAILNLMEDYRMGVSDFHMISDEASNLENIPAFFENRHDQSILSLLLKCRYLENGLETFNPLLPGKKKRIRMLSIEDYSSTTKNGAS